MDDFDRYNVTWTTPSENSSGSMPLGNGDIGLNVWIEPNGDLLFYISKTDAWNENNRLLKLGRVRVSFRPRPDTPRNFRQELRLAQGQIDVHLSGLRMRLWVDANRPVIRVEADGPDAFDVTVKLELWRNQPRPLAKGEEDSAYGLHGRSEPIVEGPDVVLAAGEDRLVWFHRNERSIWSENLTRQGLADRIGQDSDPLLHRTFGAAVHGQGLRAENPTTLRSSHSQKQFLISIYPLTAQTPGVDEWLERLNETVRQVEQIDVAAARREHEAWWRRFWDRSWIFVEGDEAAQTVTRGYLLQRFVTACAGRGEFPIKFNGAIFTVDSREPDKRFDADYRAWGGPYWFQNTRLCYWPMPAAGDFDLMPPLFDLYRRALPLARRRTEIYFNHPGAFFPETMTFWGAYADVNYGWNREGKHVSDVENTYIRYYWSGALELVSLMLDFHEFTGDEAFAKETMMPLARAILEFYDHHYPRDDRGRVCFKPAQSLEMWQNVENPMPEIAGLRSILPRLRQLPAVLTGVENQQIWQRLESQLPEVPVGQANGKSVLAAAEKIFGPAKNLENPELYAVFPYRLYGVCGGDLALGRNTFAARGIKENCGWHQDPIQAAMLGLADEAKRMVAARFSTKHPGSRFDAFWGPNYDWIPDQDHGNVASLALQQMVMQTNRDAIHLLPAWPKEWNVDFKLHAPHRTVVEGRFADGRWEKLTATPQIREKDFCKGTQ